MSVEIALLGTFDVVVDGTPAPAGGWTRRQAAALVKILALAPGHRLHREQIIDLLWPDEAPEDAAPKLHKAAHFARKATGRPDAIVLRDESVQLFPDADVVVDVVTFEDLSRQALARSDEDLARRGRSPLRRRPAPPGPLRGVGRGAAGAAAPPLPGPPPPARTVGGARGPRPRRRAGPSRAHAPPRPQRRPPRRAAAVRAHGPGAAHRARRPARARGERASRPAPRRERGARPG